MPTEITNLDELVPTPKKVELGGTVYKLPAELPVELFLRLKAIESTTDDGDENDRVEELSELVLDLFREHQPKLDKLPAGLGLVQLFRIIPTLYGVAEVAEGDGEDDPNPPTRARGKSSTRTRTAPRSAS